MGWRVVVDSNPPFQAKEGSTLLEACEEAGVEMECACGGFAACNSCRVEVIRGGHNLGEIGEEEAAFLDTSDQRLGCQATIHGPCQVRIAPGM